MWAVYPAREKEILTELLRNVIKHASIFFKRNNDIEYANPDGGGGEVW